jgi:hypothetical protein
MRRLAKFMVVCAVKAHSLGAKAVDRSLRRE